MNKKAKHFAGSRACILLIAYSLGASASDLRLPEAAQRRDKEAVRSLLQRKVDVNSRQPDGATALAWAAHWDDVEIADLLIRAGANANAANDYGVTPLSLACLNGSSVMVEKLLAASANPNAALLTGETPLMTAARTGNVQAVKALLIHGADVKARENRQGQTALMWASAEKHPSVVKFLIEFGADVHAHSKGGFTPFLFAAQQGDLESARILLASGVKINDEATPADGSALEIATVSGHEAFALFLLDQGANPNAANRYGITALHYAILKGISLIASVVWDPAAPYMFRPNMPGLVKGLLAHGANPNARILKLPPLPHYRKLASISLIGATPFLLAAVSSDASLMRILMEGGADPHLATEENSTALIYAAGLAEGLGKVRAPRTEQDERNALEAVKLAFELGDNVNAANKAGETALHGAAYVGSDVTVQFLVSHGAKIDVKDSFGQTPLSIAEQFFPPALLDDNLRPGAIHRSTADLLLKLGATPQAANAQAAP
jgi:ankyrin repeat protein